eukprot:951026-Prymnesium_polylepis.1
MCSSAICRAVMPRCSVAMLWSAPASSSVRTTFGRPLADACIKGVSPSAFIEFRFAPLLSRRRTTESWP